MIPAQLRGDKVHEKRVNYARLNFPIENKDSVISGINKNAKKQIEVINYLANKNEPILTTKITKDTGATLASIKSLAKKD